MKFDSKVLAHIALLTVALIYGLNYIAAKDVMPDFVQPRAFILIRALGATSLFWLISLFYVREKIQKRDYGRLIICGFFGVAANQMLFFEGLNITTPINASIMMTINPILVLVMSAIILKESIRLSRIIGIVLGLTGAVFLITKGAQELDILDSDKSLGNLLVLFNAASYAAYLVLVKPLMGRYKPLTVIRWVFLFGLIIIIPFGAPQIIHINWQDLPLLIIGEITYVVLLTTFFAYLLNIYALKTVTSTTVSFYVYLQPVFASIAAIALGRDEITLILVISAALIFAGVYMVSFYKR